MTEHPKWKKDRCVHCAAGMDLNLGVKDSHFNSDLPDDGKCNIQELTPHCTAGDPTRVIEELEEKIQNLLQDQEELEIHRSSVRTFGQFFVLWFERLSRWVS